MNQKVSELREKFETELQSVKDVTELENMRVAYLGKKGSITAVLKDMGKLSDEERKALGQEVNVLKNEVTDRIADKKEEFARLELEKEINSAPEIDVTIPPVLDRGSYHPITLVQRQCERIFKSMGFNVEDYSEVVTDYECFEALNIPKFHPARDMQDTYYLENGQLLKSHTSAAQNAIYKKYRKDKNRQENFDEYVFSMQDYQRGIEALETIFASKLIDVTRNRIINYFVK